MQFRFGFPLPHGLNQLFWLNKHNDNYNNTWYEDNRLWHNPGDKKFKVFRIKMIKKYTAHSTRWSLQGH